MFALPDTVIRFMDTSVGRLWSTIPARVWMFLFLLLLPIQALTAAVQLSPTMDEGAHLASGYAYLITGEYRVGKDHPPLAKVLAALPLVVTNHQVPTDVYEWEGNFLWPDQLARPDVDDIDRLFLWARLPTLLLTVLLGWVVYRWGADLFGAKAGLLALFLLAFDPAVLALSGLVNTDIAAATFITLTLYCMWRLIYQPTSGNIFWAGLAFGLAQLSKFSALILIPLICLLLFLATLLSTLHRPLKSTPSLERYPRRSLGWPIKAALGIFLIGGLVIWIGYFFNIGNFFEGALAQFLHTQGGHAAFLAGHYSTTGWWYYFPVAFVLKTPLPTILLIGLGLFLSKRRHYPRYYDNLCLWLPVIIYILVSMFTRLNIGYRYLLPLLPLVFVWTGQIATTCQKRSWLAGLIIILCGWLAIESVSIRPDYLAYFNQLAGGPANGHRWLVDSNLDWGQDLRNLKTYMDQHGLQRVKLSYFGSVSPSFYGIEYDCLPNGGAIQSREDCLNPQEIEMQIEPGVYVISATSLQGVYLANRDTFAWFRHRSPTARIGYSLFVYEVKE